MTSRLALSLKVSSNAYGDVTVNGSALAGTNVEATPVASAFAVSDDVGDVEAGLQGECKHHPILKTFHMKVGTVSDTSFRNTAQP